MKKIIAILIGLTLSTYARSAPDELYMPNASGKYVTLTVKQCDIESLKDKYLFKSYSTDEQDVDHRGCWSLTEPDPSGKFEQLVVMKFEEAPSLVFTFRKHLFSLEKKRWEE